VEVLPDMKSKSRSPDDTRLLQRLDEVTSALADLSDVLTRTEDLGRALQRSVEQVVRTIPGADMASVSVLRDDSTPAETVASSSERVWAIDDDQYAVDDGPCLEAARTGRVVRVGVEQAMERWPEFARSARAAGVASYLSAPLHVDEEFAGSLNLYSEQPHGFGDLDEALLRLYTTAAAAAIANTRRYAQARSLAAQLAQALDSRAVIDQARGILMATHGIDAQQAFELLAKESQNTNVKLREVAARLVESISPPGSGNSNGGP
jgi:GAF domain-containing protein